MDCRLQGLRLLPKRQPDRFNSYPQRYGDGESDTGYKGLLLRTPPYRPTHSNPKPARDPVFNGLDLISEF